MGRYDGVDLCELTSLYILNVLSIELGKEKIGLYRDDRLSCFQKMTGTQAGRVEKKICETFQSCGLKITTIYYTSILSQVIQKTSSKKS